MKATKAKKVLIHWHGKCRTCRWERRRKTQGHILEVIKSHLTKHQTHDVMLIPPTALAGALSRLRRSSPALQRTRKKVPNVALPQPKKTSRSRSVRVERPPSTFHAYDRTWDHADRS